MSTIELQVLRDNFKRKSVASISTNTIKTIRTELKTGNNSIPFYKDIDSIRKAT